MDWDDSDDAQEWTTERYQRQWRASLQWHSVNIGYVRMWSTDASSDRDAADKLVALAAL